MTALRTKFSFLSLSPVTLRIISALGGLSIFFATYYFAKNWGFLIICFAVAGVVLKEYNRMQFKHILPTSMRWVFVICAATVYSILTFRADFGISVFLLSFVLLFSSALIDLKKRPKSLRISLEQINLALIGLVYCSFFPAMITRLLLLDHGAQWFVAFTFIVFSVDTWAFFGGLGFGKRSLFRRISPNKTVEGALCGLIGGCLFGILAALFLLPEIPIWELALLGLTTAVVAEIGDLYVSLNKRVAEVKDTGSIMPGHGGLLDRMDGIYFSAPIFYLFALLKTTLA